jgi:hypothetical protein
MSYYTYRIDLPHLGNTIKNFPKFNLDCLSKAQIQSKEWLINELYKRVGLSEKRIAILAGWYGLLAQPLYQLCPDIKYIRSFDWDPDCTPIAESINKELLIDGWKFKATTYGVENLNWKGDVNFHTQKSNGEYQFVSNRFDIIINTSCEHMSDQWVRNVSSEQVIVAQSNDFDIPEHINKCDSPDMLIEKLGIKNVLYRGRLNTEQYTRSMVIGYK